MGGTSTSSGCLGSLCLNQAGDGLAVTDKGKTAAELMVFARYVMFSEVYWHHSVRAATAMLQRAFYLLHGDAGSGLPVPHDRARDDRRAATRQPVGGPAGELLDGLFGPTRRLYKRLAQYSFLEHRELYERLARRPYPWLAACAERFASLASTALGRVVAPHEVLFDAPPMAREVQFAVDIHFPKENRYRPLGEVSPVIRTLATRAVRRLREAGPHLRPSARSGRTARTVERVLARLPGHRPDDLK